MTDPLKLEDLTQLLDKINQGYVTDQEFTEAFQMVVDLVKSNAAVSAKTIEEIYAELDKFAVSLKGDSEQDRNTIKKMVGAAIAELRGTVTEDVQAQILKIENKLAAVKDGRDGRDADDKKIVAEVLKQLPEPKPLEETPDTIVAKVNKSGILIAKERVEGLVDAIRMAAANAVGAVGITTTNFFWNNTLIGRAKNINFTGSGVSSVTVLGDQANVVLQGGSSSATVYTETLSDSGDHQNYTATHPITQVYVLATLNGQYISSGNYTKSGNTITLSSPDAGISGAGLELVYA